MAALIIRNSTGGVMAYQYKVVPFSTRVKMGSPTAECSTQLEAIINDHAKQGWEFHQIAQINIEVQPGCLAGLGGARPTNMPIDQVVFRKAAG
jgi:hypothetical protein